MKKGYQLGNSITTL